MAKPEWGQKRICQSCGAKFYDLNKDPAVCPKCDTEQTKQGPAKSKKTPVKEAAPAKPEEQEEEETEAVEGEDDLLLDTEDDDDIGDDDDDSLMEDASDIGDDDDDMSEVKEHMEPGEDDT